MNDAVRRGIRTFLQSALAVVVAAGTDFVSVELWRGAAIAGGAALISYVYNALEDKGVAPTLLK